MEGQSTYVGWAQLVCINIALTIETPKKQPRARLHIHLVRHPADDHGGGVAPRPQPEPRRRGAGVELVILGVVLVTRQVEAGTVMAAVAVRMMAGVLEAVADDLGGNSGRRGGHARRGEGQVRRPEVVVVVRVERGTREDDLVGLDRGGGGLQLRPHRRVRRRSRHRRDVPRTPRGRRRRRGGGPRDGLQLDWALLLLLLLLLLLWRRGGGEDRSLLLPLRGPRRNGGLLGRRRRRVVRRPRRLLLLMQLLWRRRRGSVGRRWRAPENDARTVRHSPRVRHRQLRREEICSLLQGSAKRLWPGCVNTTAGRQLSSRSGKQQQ